MVRVAPDTNGNDPRKATSTHAPGEMSARIVESSVATPSAESRELSNTCLKLSKFIAREAQRSVVRNLPICRMDSSEFNPAMFRSLQSGVLAHLEGRRAGSVASTFKRPPPPSRQNSKSSSGSLDGSNSIGQNRIASGKLGQLSKAQRAVSSSRIRARSFGRISTVVDPEAEKKKSSLRKKLDRMWDFFDDPNSSKAAYNFSIGFFFFITMSTVLFIIQTEKEIDAQYSVQLGYIETVCAVVFTSEFVCRLLCCPKPMLLAKDYANWIDIASILPFYLELLLDVEGAGSFGAIRIVRLTRVARVLKMSRYSSSIQVFVESSAISIKALTMLFFLMSIAMVVFSSAIYFEEYTSDGCRKGGYDPSCNRTITLSNNPDVPPCCVNPNPYKSITSSFWWCIVTMSTVGYGDMTPVTIPGKLIGSCTILTGTLVLALPITVIGNNFQKVMKSTVHQAMKNNVDFLRGKRMICRKEIEDILRRFNIVAEEVHLSIEEVISVYDTNNSGMLEDDELERFSQDLEILQNRAFSINHPNAMFATASTQRMASNWMDNLQPHITAENTLKPIAIPPMLQGSLALPQGLEAPLNYSAANTISSLKGQEAPPTMSGNTMNSVAIGINSSYASSKNNVDESTWELRFYALQREMEDRLMETEVRLENKIQHLTKIAIRIEEMLEMNNED